MTAGTGGPHATRSSPLAAALQRFLEGRRAAGYRYRAEAEGLGALDRFLPETLSPTDPVITNDIVRALVARRGTESETTRAHRLSLIRGSVSLPRTRRPGPFVPATRFLGIHRRTRVPRVLSLEEGRRFLDACETLDRQRSSPRRELVFRTLLVALYLTGLRADEGLRLTLADVDLETAVLRIRDTKFGKSRLVPVAADVASRLAHCRNTVTAELGERPSGEPFFPAPSRWQSRVISRERPHRPSRWPSPTLPPHERLRPASLPSAHTYPPSPSTCDRAGREARASRPPPPPRSS